MLGADGAALQKTVDHGVIPAVEQLPVGLQSEPRRRPQHQTDHQAASCRPRHTSQQPPTIASSSRMFTFPCQEFVTDYVMSFRNEVAAFCDQVVEQKGNVHGRTLTAIRARISRFHSMNVFDRYGVASQLDQLKQQIAGLTGQDLDQQPDVAAKLSEACAKLREQMLAPDSVSQLTGRLRRRVVLE